MIKNNIFLLIVLVLLTASACNKDAVLLEDSNSNLIGLTSIDSIKVKSSTIADEPANGIDQPSTILGATSDSRFGYSKASFYSQMSLSQNSFDLGSNPVLDSIVLVLNTAEYYGDLNAFFDIEVYQLNHVLESTSDYDNNTVLNLKSPALAMLSNFKFDENTQNLRLKLDDTFGNDLLSQFGTTVMESSDGFKEYFNGIYVTASSLNGDGLVSLNLKNDNTSLQMHYSSDLYTDTVFRFVVDNSDIVVNQYTHDLSGSEASVAILDNNVDEAISYISSMTSVKTLLEFPDLTSLSEVIINKAELTIYQEDYASSENLKLPEPDRLFLFQNNNDTSILFLPDFSLSNPNPFGGFKELVEINGQNTNQYTFNITRYIQSLVNGSSEYNQLILQNISNNDGSRIKIAGGNHSDLPIKLEILYTKKQ